VCVVWCVCGVCVCVCGCVCVCVGVWCVCVCVCTAQSREVLVIDARYTHEDSSKNAGVTLPTATRTQKIRALQDNAGTFTHFHLIVSKTVKLGENEANCA